MGFQVLKRRAGRTSTGTVKVAIRKVGANSSLTLVVAIAGDVAGQAGLSDASRVLAFVGDGDDAGQIAFAACDTGGFTIYRRLSQTMTVHLPIWVGLPREPHPIQEVRWEVAGKDPKRLVIKLPPWPGTSWKRFADNERAARDPRL